MNGLANHPIHLHGYDFEVHDMGTLAQLQNGTSAFTNANHLPVIKDTVLVPSGCYVIIKFLTCNPGYWFVFNYIYCWQIGNVKYNYFLQFIFVTGTSTVRKMFNLNAAFCNALIKTN